MGKKNTARDPQVFWFLARLTWNVWQSSPLVVGRTVPVWNGRASKTGGWRECGRVRKK